MSSWGDILTEQLGDDILMDQQQTRRVILTAAIDAGRIGA
jgi:hypothetical protein